MHSNVYLLLKCENLKKITYFTVKTLPFSYVRYAMLSVANNKSRWTARQVFTSLLGVQDALLEVQG